MASGKETASAGMWKSLLHVDVYKRSQGRWTRQVTAAAVFITFALAAWRMSVYFRGDTSAAIYLWVPLLLVLFGAWFSFRLVNMPGFADFLIAVEAEMNKVSWPTRRELIRSSVVVIVTMFFLAFMLLIYDFVWIKLLTALGVIG